MALLGQEKQIFEGNQTELSEAEAKLYAIIVPEARTRAVKLDEFIGVRDKNAVDADKKSVKDLENIFRRENSGSVSQNRVKRGELFEAIVNDQIEASNWFGENAFVIMPSRYDDIKNGIDGIIKFKTDERGKSVILAIDITKDADEIKDKLSGIKKSIESGQLTMIKYFRSEDETVSREPIAVPRVIVGADQKTIREISELLLLFKTRQKHPAAGQPGEFKEARERLQNNKLQSQLLLEIKTQLESFLSYAKKLRQTILAKKYKEVLEIINGVLAEKESADNYNPDYAELENDNVYRAIIEKAASASFKTFGGL